MTAIEIAAVAQPIVAAAVGVGQILIVRYGIRAMIAASQDRAAGAAEAARRADERHAEAARRADERHAEAMAGHAETMAAFEAQRRTDAEAARRADERHAEAMAALAALIERTAPEA